MSDGIVEKALSSLGKGFDLSSDFRLKYCKGDGRLILLNESETRQLAVPGFGSIGGVSVDIRCDKGDRTRYQTDILDFNQMSEFFNQKCSVAGKIPSGLFNTMFGFQSGSWAADASGTRSLGLDGYFIEMFTLHIDRSPLVLAQQVRDDVPSKWDPAALARFISKYGTHIIVGMSIGGQDVILVKQEKSSNIEPSQLKNHLDNLGDQLFTGTCTFSPHQTKNKEQKHKAPQAFNVFDPHVNSLNNYASAAGKDGISVMCSKRGGDTTVGTHCEWLVTVPSNPDAIHFNFIPITSLLRGVPGRGFLSHAINLYLRYKPPVGDLQYFLDFQAHRIWAPIHNDLPLGPARNKIFQTPSLNFNLMGPKLYINTTQVTTNTPVTGMRLYLEGIKCNSCVIQVRHTSATLHKPPIPSPRQAPTPPNNMAWIRSHPRLPPLLRAPPMEEILPHLHRPRQVRPPLAQPLLLRRRLHRHRSPNPRRQTRFQERPPPPPTLLQGLLRLRGPVELDAVCLRAPFIEIGVFLDDQHHHSRELSREGEGGGGDSGLRGVPHGAARAGAEAAEVCGHVAAVQGAVG